MDNLFFVLMVVFFIVAPILEKALKGKRPQQPGQPRPGQPRERMPPQRRPLPDGRTVTTRPGTSETATTAGDATDLLPADLWEMLTGQRRPPVADEAPLRTLPEPRSEATSLETRAPAKSEGDVSSWTEGAARHNLEAADEVQRRRERERRSYSVPTRTVVSLETEPLPELRRHAAYHDKVGHLAPVETVRGRPVRLDLDLDFENSASLRRAMILQEVLGRPKGLD